MVIDANTLYVRQEVDELHRAGQWSSVSDQRRNVHWLTGTTHDTYLFSAKVIDLNPTVPTEARIAIDILHGRADGDVIAAPRISRAEARERYG